MKREILVCLTIAVGLIGCESAVKLDGSGERVQLVDYIKPDERSKLVEVDQVNCKLGENGLSWSLNVEGCQNQIRNLAAVKGGSLVLVTAQDTKRYEMGTGMKLMAQTNHCENCVEMRGVVFKKK